MIIKMTRWLFSGKLTVHFFPGLLGKVAYFLMTVAVGVFVYTVHGITYRHYIY